MMVAATRPSVTRKSAGLAYRRQPIDPLREIPRGSRVPLVLLAVAVWATSLAAMTSLPGQPEYEPRLRRYVYDDQGVLVPASRAAYLHAVAVQNRLFLGAALVFTSVAVAITWGERNRRRRARRSRCPPRCSPWQQPLA
jgi:hypothetical protein